MVNVYGRKEVCFSALVLRKPNVKTSNEIVNILLLVAYRFWHSYCIILTMVVKGVFFLE